MYQLNWHIGTMIMRLTREYERACTLLYRCKFAGRNCSKQMLTETFTDMGRCYAFNNDLNERLHSNATGRLESLDYFSLLLFSAFLRPNFL